MGEEAGARKTEKAEFATCPRVCVYKRGYSRQGREESMGNRKGLKISTEIHPMGGIFLKGGKEPILK